jgi:hypothetical protein
MATESVGSAGMGPFRLSVSSVLGTQGAQCKQRTRPPGSVDPRPPGRERPRACNSAAIRRGTRLAPVNCVDVSQPNPSPGRSLGARIAFVVAVAGVIALTGLIARELFPHHLTAHAPTSGASAVAASDAPTRAPLTAAEPHRAPTSAAAPHESSPGAAAQSSTSAALAVPLAATVIAQVAANPEAFAPSTVFSPPAAQDQVYNYEPLPPFNSTTLKRTRKNPSAWELDAMRGPKMKDLGPEGAVRQAALVRDSIGNETPWFAIDSGPLAPAFAVMQGSAMRVMSRAFLLENRASLPPEVASALDK